MSIANPQPEVIDERRHNFTIIDNEVFDIYAEHIGPQGIALYCALVRFAHQDRDTFPSHANLGKKSGMSTRSVQKYLPLLTHENSELAKHGLGPLVEIRRRHRSDGGQTSNLYALLPIAKAAPPPRQMPADPPRQTCADDEYGSYEEVLRTDRDQQQEPEKPTKRARRIDPIWWPGDNLRDWCAKEGFTPQQVDLEAAQFKDHHTAKGSLMKDWQAAFRTWMRNSRKWSNDKNTPSPKPPTTEELRKQVGYQEPPPELRLYEE